MVKTAASSTSINVAEPRSNEVKYKGVRKRKWGKYVSEIRLPNSRERIWLGSYDTAEKAARAFDAALFCLRGHNAKFNFPDDQPNIAGGQSLTPDVIQAVAQQYANSYSAGSSSNQPQQPANGGDGTWNSDGAGRRDSFDWSFLDTLDSSNVENAGNVSDFGLFHDPEDMYMSHHFADRQNDDEDDEDQHGNGGNVQSFLWNF
ncbi:hypothetical protein BUALT_Bualt10G0101400 [Buddleja alternifolia]|uniref:AP2/ERF domain-containing protein n=1 Tax=Buddleja alternifolia TaxID=168488 RepID=A0AAV6X668_9LAMI|nr:hypothetical protein BUALT_Bualt10G0101400 [Buddleja alternifolia]